MTAPLEDDLLPLTHTPTRRPGLLGRLLERLRPAPARLDLSGARAQLAARSRGRITTHAGGARVPPGPPRGPSEAQPDSYRYGGQTRTPWADGIAEGLDADRVLHILRAASRGDPRRLAELLTDIQDRDLHLLGVLNTRYSAVANLTWTITPAGERRRDEKIADFVTATIAAIPDLELALRDLLTGIYYGYSLSEIAWVVRGDRVVVADLAYTPPWWFRPDPDHPRAWRVMDQAAPSWGKPLTPGRWLVHTPRAKTGFPVQAGLGRPVLWWYLFKIYAVKDWAAYTELFGSPFRVGYHPPETTDNEIEKVHLALQQLGVDASAAVPKGTEIKFEGDSSKGGPDVYNALVTLCDKAMAKGILGQTLTTEEGERGTQALGNVHNQVRGDIRDADARALARTLQRGLIAPLVAWNFGADVPCPQFSFDIEPPADEKAAAEADKARAGAQNERARVFVEGLKPGLEIPLEQVREELGIRPVQAGEALLEKPEAPRQEDVETAPLCFVLPVTGEALADWASAYNAALGVLGRPGAPLDALDGGGAPHVTLLYVGDVGEDERAEVAEIAAGVIADAGPIVLEGQGVGWFEPGPQSAGAGGEVRTPIVMRYESEALAALNGALLRALARFITAEQFPTFEIHATLGMLPRVLRPREREALAALGAGRVTWRPRSVHLMSERERVEGWSLG